MSEGGDVRLGTRAGRWVLVAMVMGSGMSFLDSLMVNVALPRMDADLGLGVTGLQWTVSGYLLTLSALLLLGGSLGDRYGRRRVYLIGVAVFTAASVACGLAVTTEILVIARLAQGAGGALMVPAGIAIIQSVFVPEHRGKAIGIWTGLGGVFTTIGPLVGGAFTTYLSWRWAFFINVPLGAACLCITNRFVPESRSSDAHGAPDFIGALLCVVGLAGLVYWSIEGAWWAGIAGAIVFVAFLASQRNTAKPMMPLSLFSSAQFNWVNLCTVLFYGAFVGGTTFLGVRLQTSLGYSPLLAGVATLPVNIFMLAFSGRFGDLAQRIGPKLPMTVGPLLVSGSLLWMSQIEDGRGYWTFVLPAIVLWGVGLSAVVAPLTSAALAAADQRHVGVASALNNAASRAGSAFAIAALPTLAGMGGGQSLGGPAFDSGYDRAMLIASAICAIAAMVAWLKVDNHPAPTAVSVDD